MPKLNQVNALVKGRKSEIEKAVGDVYKLIQKPELFDGRLRTYQPKDIEGDQLPQERQIVQYKAKDMLGYVKDKWADLWDLVTTQDSGNQLARADIEIEVPGTDKKQVIANQVPITTLLFLEKQVNDLETFLSKLPVTDAAREWQPDAQTDLLKSNPVNTSRSKKILKALVKYDATKEHPAQVDTYQEDVVVGVWTEVQFSGRMLAKDKNQLLTKVRSVKDAIKLARERANSLDVERKKVAKGIFDFILAD